MRSRREFVSTRTFPQPPVTSQMLWRAPLPRETIMKKSRILAVRPVTRLSIFRIDLLLDLTSFSNFLTDLAAPRIFAETLPSSTLISIRSEPTVSATVQSPITYCEEPLGPTYQASAL